MLTDAAIRSAKPTEKPYKLTDYAGLYVHITPTGSKLWRMRYEYNRKEKLLSFGPYPDVSLAEAREQRDKAKRLLRDGRDPGIEKKLELSRNLEASENTFEVVARDWHSRTAPSWTERHAADVLTSLARDVFPRLGSLPISEIKAPTVLAVLRTIEARPAVETARRVRQRMSAIFVFGIASGRCETDPAAIVQGAMAPLIKGRQPAIVDLEDAREVLKRAEAVPAHPVTRLALRLLALTAVRPGEIRGAAWAEFEQLDGDEPVWRVPASRMKMKLEHLVPLSRQALEIIDAVRPLTGRGPLVFPNARHAHRPMSENAIGYLLNPDAV